MLHIHTCRQDVHNKIKINLKKKDKWNYDLCKMDGTGGQNIK